MNEDVLRSISDVLTYLSDLDREKVPPEDAERRLSLLRRRHPDLSLELLWEIQSYDASVHYDVLLRRCDGSVISISVSSERELPWPLRGAHRWTDADLVRVNGSTLKIQHAVSCLEFMWNETPVAKRLVDACLVAEELKTTSIETSDIEMQLGMDAFRRTHALYSAEETYRWMTERGMTHQQLEELILDSVRIDRLRGRIAEGRIDGYFRDHQADLAVLQFVQLECADEHVAEQVFRELTASELGFYETAQTHYTAARVAGLKFVTVRRCDMPAALVAALSAAAPNDVVGPTHVANGYVITRLLQESPPRLDEATRAFIRNLLFEQWLEERRGAAAVEWCWGSALP